MRLGIRYLYVQVSTKLLSLVPRRSNMLFPNFTYGLETSLKASLLEINLGVNRYV